MALTIYEAARLTQNPLARDTFLSIATSDEMMAKLRFEQADSPLSFSWPREGATVDPAFVDANHASITEGTGNGDLVTRPLRMLIGDADTYVWAMQANQNLVADELDRKVKAAGRVISQKAILGGYVTGATITPAIAGVAFQSVGTGVDSLRAGGGDIKFQTGAPRLSWRAPGDRDFGAEVLTPSNGVYMLRSDNPNKWLRVTVTFASLPGSGTEANITFASTTHEPDGLFKELPAIAGDSQVAMSVGANGDALSFATLDMLIDDMVKTRGDRAFVGNSKLKAKFLALLRTAGGLTGSELAVPGINGPVPTYRGIPFLQNDWIPSTEVKGSGTTLSSLLLMDFEPGGFVCGYAGRNPGMSDEARIATLDPSQGSVLGINIRRVGELEAKEAVRHRVVWRGAFGLKSRLAAARACELITA
jgi:hypothetical protein